VWPTYIQLASPVPPSLTAVYAVSQCCTLRFSKAALGLSITELSVSSNTPINKCKLCVIPERFRLYGPCLQLAMGSNLAFKTFLIFTALCCKCLAGRQGPHIISSQGSPRSCAKVQNGHNASSISAANTQGELRKPCCLPELCVSFCEAEKLDEMTYKVPAALSSSYPILIQSQLSFGFDQIQKGLRDFYSGETHTH
jgi:hypothetical protein